jgi:hypothetical protein
MMDYECRAVGRIIDKETEVLGENLQKCDFVHHKSHMTYFEIEPGSPWWKAYD